MSSMEMMMRNQPVPEQLPVLRHGPVITHILDSAISCSGPSDPRLFTLLENDEMAQVGTRILILKIHQYLCAGSSPRV